MWPEEECGQRKRRARAEVAKISSPQKPSAGFFDEFEFVALTHGDSLLGMESIPSHGGSFGKRQGGNHVVKRGQYG